MDRKWVRATPGDSRARKRVQHRHETGRRHFSVALCSVRLLNGPWHDGRLIQHPATASAQRPITTDREESRTEARRAEASNGAHPTEAHVKLRQSLVIHFRPRNQGWNYNDYLSHNAQILSVSFNVKYGLFFYVHMHQGLQQRSWSCP